MKKQFEIRLSDQVVLAAYPLGMSVTPNEGFIILTLDASLVQSTDDGFSYDGSIDQVKQALQSAIITRANAMTAPILAKYPQAETLGWGQRAAEARQILSVLNDATSTTRAKERAIARADIIGAHAQRRGLSIAETEAHCQSIISNATAFARISEAVEAMRDDANAGIDAAADWPALHATVQALLTQAISMAKQYGLMPDGNADAQETNEIATHRRG